jgi:hypothetical protein
MMGSNTNNNWSVGDLATLERKQKPLKKGGSTVYERYIGSRYICIREASEQRRGILMKVLGKPYSDQIKIVNGQPFCEDYHDELFEGDLYASYSFPSANEVKEALEIIRGNQALLQKFEKESMHINPDSTFWVKEITHNVLFLKKLQYIDGRDGQLSPATNDSNHYRVTFVYFRDGKLIW